MKNSITICLAVLCFQNLNAQWMGQASGILPSGYAITSLSVVNATTVWVVANDLFMLQAHNAAGNQARVLKTTNGGISWTTHIVVSDVFGIDISAIDGNTAFVTVNDFGLNQGVYKTTNSGTTWTLISPSPGSGSGSVVRHFSNNELVLFNNGGAKISSDGGVTWNPPASLPSFLGTESHVYDNAHNGFAVSGNKAWFGTNQHRIFRSTDKGNTWTNTTIQSFPVNSVIQTVGFIDTLKGLAIASMLYPNYNYDVVSRCAKTSNGGGIWLANPNPPALIANVCGIPGSANAFLGVAGVTGTSPVTAITVDGGANWFIVNTTEALSAVQFISATTGWAANANPASGNNPAIYKWGGNPVGSEELTEPSSFNIYPNPAVDFISVNTYNNDQSIYQLKIIDQSGRVCRQMNNYKAGEQFYIDGLNAGLYFVSIESDSKFMCRKLLVQ